MNQKLSDWASIAEIISGIAVVVTLIFLIAGIRENTAVLRGSSYSNTLESLNQLQAAVMADSEMALAWEAFLDHKTSDIDEGGRARLRMAVASLMRIYEVAYFQHEYGLLGEAEWVRFASVGCQNFSRVQSFLPQMIETGGPFTDEFLNYMTDNCEG